MFDWLVEVVGDGGSVRLHEEVPLATDQGIMKAADDSLNDGLYMAAETPQSRRQVPRICTRLSLTLGTLASCIKELCHLRIRKKLTVQRAPAPI